MKLETVKLRGLMRFDQEVALDLRDVPAGLIAIVGPNGEGKTTLLESSLAALFRSFISRADRPLTDYAGGNRDAYIETTFAVEGRGVYRARVGLDGAKGGSEAVLELVAPDGARAFLNDGKVTTFDAAIAQAFPPKAVLLASAFAAQNRAGSFVTISRGERKDLFAQLLGLAQYAEFAQTARQAAAALDVARAERRAVVTRLEDEAGAAVTEAIADEANALQHQLLDAEDALKAIDARIAQLTLALTEARAQAARRAAALDALAALDAEHRELAGKQARAKADLAALDVTAERTRAAADAARRRRVAAAEDAIAKLPTVDALAQRHQRELSAVHTETAADLADREERRRNNAALIEQAADIREAAGKLTEALARAEALTEARRGIRERLRAAEEAVDAAKADVTALADARRDLERCREDAGLRDEVPCGGAGAFAACQFLTRAAEALAAIPAHEQKVAALAGAEAALTEARRASDAIARELDANDAQQTANANAITDLRPIADRLPRVEAAEQRLADLDRDIADIGAAKLRRIAQVDADAAARHAERAGRLDELTAEIAAADAEHRAEVTALEAQTADDRQGLTWDFDDATAALAALAPRLAAAAAEAEAARAGQAAVGAAERALDDARAEAVTAAAELSRLQERGRHLAARREAVQAKHAELTAIRGELTVIETDAIEWQALGRVFGKEGLPVLEIDAAGPTISAITNDLLQACFGARFTVELVTQEAKKSGGFKEAFDLKVWDAERPGRERDVSDLSGGEQVLIDEALKSAIAIFVNTRNEYPLRTCWRDETTGALDAENAERYIHMLRRVQERGGFAHVLFISHNREAAAMADLQLHVEGGAIEVLHAPFERRAA